MPGPDIQHYKAALEETRDFNKYLMAQCAYWEDRARQAEAELEQRKKK